MGNTIYIFIQTIYTNSVCNLQLILNSLPHPIIYLQTIFLQKKNYYKIDSTQLKHCLFYTNNIIIFILFSTQNTNAYACILNIICIYYVDSFPVYQRFDHRCLMSRN